MPRAPTVVGESVEEMLLPGGQSDFPAVTAAAVDPDDELIFVQNHAYVCWLILAGNVAMVRCHHYFLDL